jgi:hypothetical protein
LIDSRSRGDRALHNRDQEIGKTVFIQSVLKTRAPVLLALLLLTACASDKKQMQLYAGPERPSEEIARLLFVESLEVTRINGELIPRIPRIIRWGERRLDLLPGGYDVVAHYDAVWQLNASEDEVVRSESQRLDLELEAGHIYRIEHRPLVDLEDARLLARDLKLTVVDLSSGRPVPVTVESRPAVVSTPLVVNPVLAVKGDVGTAAAANQAESAAASAGGTDGISVSPRGTEAMAAVEVSERNARTVPIAKGAPAADVSQVPSAAALLKFWWQRASPEERARFRGWIEE